MRFYCPSIVALH